MRFPENPVLTKELRTRMRGTRAYWILFAYVGLPSLIVFLTYATYTAFQSGNGQNAFQLGKVFYSTVFTIQALLVGIITPALTAGGVSLEKEQRTYDLLSLSLLPRRGIILGKLLSATLFVALLLTASLPLASLCFLLGGIAPSQVITAYVLLLSCAFLYGAVGIAASSVAKSTTNATSLAYTVILILFFCTLPLAIAGITGPFGGNGVGLTALNPIGAVSSGINSEVYFGLSLSPWLPALLVNGMLGVVLTVAAIHRLEYPRSDRTPLLRTLCAAFTLLLAFFLYGFTAPQAAGVSGNSLMAVSILTLLATTLIAAIFATGDGLPTSGGLIRLIFDPRRLRTGDAASGLLYGVLLVLICGAVLYIGTTNSSRPASLRLVLLSLSLLWLLGTLGIWFSAAARSRWAALTATLAAAVVVSVGPMCTQITVGNSPRRPTVLDNLLYLSPFPAASELSGSGSKSLRTPALLFQAPFRMVTPALYGLLGIGFLGLAERARRASRTVVPPAS
ncbi:MAG: ABC transporter permease subunit [Cytophagales bacterium]|nr:ABC transporter permease subunit [Armatimonadota bacterium]